MRKERKVCIRITPRRIMGAVLIGASVVNLIIVGSAFELTFPGAVPTHTVTRTASPATETLSIPAVTETEIVSATSEPTDTPTFTSTPTPTDTASPTITSTLTPVIKACQPRYAWPVYIVQRGDTLYSLAIATGSSVNELMLANCLPDSLIITGRWLYVPRLPIPTATPSLTPSYTPVTPADSPTVFRNPSLCYASEVIYDQEIYTIHFSVSPYDLEGIRSILTFYRINDSAWREVRMTPTDTYYIGSGALWDAPREGDTVQYYFSATDNAGNVVASPPDGVRLDYCNILN